MKIKSILDVITNSSSETFIIKSTESKKFIEDYLKTIDDPNWSGMGGILEVKDTELETKNKEKIYNICIDWSKEKTIQALLNDFFVLDTLNEHYCTRDKNGKIIKLYEGEELTGDLYNKLQSVHSINWEYLKEYVRGLKWKSGMKFLINLNFENINPDISPEDNLEIIEKQYKAKCEEILDSL